MNLSRNNFARKFDGKKSLIQYGNPIAIFYIKFGCIFKEKHETALIFNAFYLTICSCVTQQDWV